MAIILLMSLTLIAASYFSNASCFNGAKHLYSIEMFKAHLSRLDCMWTVEQYSSNTSLFPKLPSSSTEQKKSMHTHAKVYAFTEDQTKALLSFHTSLTYTAIHTSGCKFTQRSKVCVSVAGRERKLNKEELEFKSSLVKPIITKRGERESVPSQTEGVCKICKIKKS